MKTITPILFFLLLLCEPHSLEGQCVDSSNVYTFKLNGKQYDVIRERMTWVEAADCAVQLGGHLAEIESEEEQMEIFAQLKDSASIDTDSTIAPDGGGASYVWLGGSDLANEGEWLWDGNNDSIGGQFWMGDFNGMPVAGAYNNWGREPDDFGSGQDGLGLALTNWPLGVAGEWNDVAHTNNLYFVVEYGRTVRSDDKVEAVDVKVFPNPVGNEAYINIPNSDLSIEHLWLSDMIGRKVVPKHDLSSSPHSIDLSNLPSGTYILKVLVSNGQETVKKIIK